MWKTKKFKSSEARFKWVVANSHRYWIIPLFIGNGHAVEYRRLKK